MNWIKRLSFLLVCLIIAILLYGCSAAAQGTPVEEVPTAVEQPAVEQQPIPVAPSAQTTAEVTVITMPTVLTTPQVPVIEYRQVELEWPARMKFGESDVIRLALVPDKEGYQITAEFPDHSTQSQQVTVNRTPGYTLYGIARLDGVGFLLSPVDEQKYELSENETVTWRWSISPKSNGQQRVSISLVLRWEPQSDAEGLVREELAFSRGLNIEVSSLLGMTQPQAVSFSFMGLIAGSAMTLGGVFLRDGKKKRQSAITEMVPNNDLVLEPGAAISISNEDAILLKTLFNRHERLILESEFLSGYSGARTFLVRPILQGSRQDAQTIVKIGQRTIIQREYDNYEHFVKDRLPPITARIQRMPISVSGNPKAALQYTFLAEPGQSPLSLHKALLQNPQPGLISRLFETFAPHWWLQRSPYAFRLEQEYDALLPPHLVLEPLMDGHANVISIKPDMLPSEAKIMVGQVVRVAKFATIEPRADGQSLSLAGFAQNGQPAIRVRWMSLDVPDGTPARVVHTRQSLFQQYIDGMDLCGLPDPLNKLDALLQKPISGTRSVIHGDLNLENVLVGPGNLVWLIDFALTDEGHPLRDFAHLYMEIIAHVLYPRGYTPEQFLQLLQLDQEPLLREVEQIARRCQLDAAAKDEFHLATGISCLGALKYTNLPAGAKQLLLIAAAYLLSDQ